MFFAGKEAGTADYVLGVVFGPIPVLIVVVGWVVVDFLLQKKNTQLPQSIMNSLNPLTLILGVTCLGIFFGWLLGRRSESWSAAFDSLTTALVAFGALCIAPFFFYGAWHQFGAKSRLQTIELPVCPGFGHAVGAQGGRAPRCIWRFEALDDSASILEFYVTACTQAGWKVDRRKNGLLLSKPGFTISLWTEHHGNDEQIVIKKLP